MFEAFILIAIVASFAVVLALIIFGKTINENDELEKQIRDFPSFAKDKSFNDNVNRYRKAKTEAEAENKRSEEIRKKIKKSINR